MKKGDVLLLAGLGLLIYFAAQLGTAANTAQLVFNGVAVNSPTNFTLKFLVQNISNATVNFNGLTGVVSINGNQVGNISTFTPVQIQPVSQQGINITFTPNALGIAAEIAQMINQGGQTLDFNVSGNMNVDTLVIPFNVDESITV